MAHVLINGSVVELPDGSILADALKLGGIHLPTLCHDERLTPTGACRSCLVRIKGLPRLVPACGTRVTEGMEIETTAEDAAEARRGILELLAARYPDKAIHEDPGKPFHAALTEHHLAGNQSAAYDSELVDRSHPYIAVDMNLCIQCARCVRICDEVQGQFVWHLNGRGDDSRIVPDGQTLRDSSCVACGACVDTCPTGALEDAAFAIRPRATEWTRTVCPYCGTGCELLTGTSDGAIVSVKPARHSSVSKGHLCVKGRYAFEYVSAGDRITEPLIREDGRWRPATWEEALALVASRFKTIIEEHGADALGVLASARQTNEENYLTQKFARIVIGTNNVDCCARVCHAPSSTALKRALGAGLSTNSFDDIERAGLILICGANPTENHPVIGARIKQAVRRHGTKLIVIDPRRIELAHYADSYLAVHPGANIALLNAMAYVIVREDLVDRAFVETRIDGYEAFAQSIQDWPPERVADICGVEASEIRRAARLYASTGPAMIVNGLGVTEHVQGTDGVSALINLALLTGNVGKPGSGINALRGQNNVQGAAHMGCEPRTLPGSLSIEAGKAAFERLWKHEIPATTGLHEIEMLDAAAHGRLKALWVIGYDVLLTNPNLLETTRAFAELDFVVVQDLFMTETARRFGSVFLPACSSFEKDGTFMNAERRIQRVRQALKPAGASKPDWQIICELARTMGHSQGFDFDRPRAVWDEVREGCEGARGMSYARLDVDGLQWPCPAESHPGTPILHVNRFASGIRAPLMCVTHDGTPERPTPKYPFVLTTGRSLYEFNASTMTGRCRTRELRPSDLLDISPDDAASLDIRNGDRIRISSRYGSTTLCANVTRSVRSGELFATFHTTEGLLNTVTGPHGDTVTGTPEYKLTAVRIDRDAKNVR